jgi:hypothetical protein
MCLTGMQCGCGVSHGKLSKDQHHILSPPSLLGDRWKKGEKAGVLSAETASVQNGNSHINLHAADDGGPPPPYP